MSNQQTIAMLRDELHIMQLKNQKLHAENKQLKFDTSLSSSLTYSNLAKSAIPDDKKIFNQLFKDTHNLTNLLIQQSDTPLLRQFQRDLQATVNSGDLQQLVALNTQLTQFFVSELNAVKQQKVPELDGVQERYKKFKDFVEQNKTSQENSYNEKFITRSAITRLELAISTLYQANEQVFTVKKCVDVQRIKFLAEGLERLIAQLQQRKFVNKGIQCKNINEDEITELKATIQQSQLQIDFYREMFESQKEDLESVVKYTQNVVDKVSNQESSQSSQFYGLKQMQSQIHLPLNK